MAPECGNGACRWQADRLRLSLPRPGRPRPERPGPGRSRPALLPGWDVALSWAGRWADEADRLTAVDSATDALSGMPTDVIDAGPAVGDLAPRAGITAATWAVLKASATVFGAPVSLPTMALAGRRAQQVALARIDAFDRHLQALAEGGESPLPAQRRRRLASDRRVVVTSDLHRCVPGRLDWPLRQRTKDLSLRVLAAYAEQGWDLVENGDIEDFWLVGGSTWGTVYDVARIGGGLGRSAADGARRRLLTEHLDRIVDNNAATYRLLRDGFCADGRYHRTMGNHDDVFVDTALVEHLGRHLPGVDVVDTVVLTRPDALAAATGPDAAGLGGVDAFIAHGHLTDAWNGPGSAFLGQVITWMATAFDDFPGLGGAVNGATEEADLGRLLTGRGRNRLITLDPRFGGNRRFDSLDEERLFARLGSAGLVDPMPWLVFGHTHIPMLRPLDAGGAPVRYANSGTGLLEGAVSLIEWDPEHREPRLVIWCDEPGGPRGVELVADGARLAVRDRT